MFNNIIIFLVFGCNNGIIFWLFIFNNVTVLGS